MFDWLRNVFAKREAFPSGSVVRVGTASPVGLRIPTGIVHRTTGEHESHFRQIGSEQPIELWISFLQDQTQSLTTPELEFECLSRLRPECEIFNFGSNFVVAESREVQESRGSTIYLYHTLSIKGLICTATLVILRDSVDPSNIHKFRDAMVGIFSSIHPLRSTHGDLSQ